MDPRVNQNELEALLKEGDELIEHDITNLEAILNEPEDLILSQDLILGQSISIEPQSDLKRRVSFGSYGSIRLDDLDKFIEFNQQELFNQIIDPQFELNNILNQDESTSQCDSDDQQKSTKDIKIEPQQIKKPDPLDVIDSQERQVDEEVKNQVNLYYQPKMILSQVPEQVEIKNIEIHLVKSLDLSNQKVDSNPRLGKSIKGQPCIIDGFPLLFIGSTLSEIAMFKDNQLIMVLKPQDIDVGPVTALAQQSNFLIAGYEKAIIMLWDSNSGALLKSFNHHNQCIIALKFYNNMKFLSSDLSGTLCVTILSKVLWSYNTETHQIYSKLKKPIYFIDSHKYEYKNQSYCIVSLCQEDSIIIMTIDPTSSVLLRVTRNDASPPLVSWGIFYIKQDAQISLVIVWGKLIELYIFSQETNVIQEYSHYVNQSKILFCKWVSQDMLLIYDEQNNLSTLFSGWFVRQFLPIKDRDQLIIDNSGFYKRALQSQFELVIETLVQKLVKTQNFKDIKNYQCGFSTNPQTNQFLIIGKNKCLKGKVLMWSEYLKQLIDNTESQDLKVWYLMLQQTLKIYRGEVKCFAKIQSSEKMIQYLSQDIASTFLDIHYQRANTSTEEWEQALLAIIQFCLETNQMNHLFLELETQIIKINQATVYQICLDNKMYTPLMYLCPKIDNDFITPLYKIYQKWILENDLTLLHRCLWFMRLTLKGYLFPNELIPQQQWKITIKQIIMWLLVDEIFRSFAINVTDQLFNVLQMIFYEPCKSAFTEYDLNFMRFFDDNFRRSPQIQKDDTSSQTTIAVSKDDSLSKNVFQLIIKKIYSTLQSTLVTYPHVRQKFAKFIANVYQKHYIRVEPEIALKCIKVLIQLNSQKINKYLDLTMSLLKSLDKFNESTKDFEELIKLAQINDVYEIVAYLYFLNGQKELAFDKFINDPDNSTKKIRVFKWIKGLLSYNPPKSKDRQFLLDQIRLYFNQLTLINDNLFSEIISVLESSEQISILKDQPPHLLLILMQQVMQWREKGIVYKQDLNIFYIKLLVVYMPNKILNEIQTHHYNLEELEIILNENNHFEGLGYVYEKWGKHNQAIFYYLKEFKSYSQEQIQTSLQNNRYGYYRLNKKFQNIYRTCQQCDNNEQDNVSNQFIKVNMDLSDLKISFLRNVRYTLELAQRHQWDKQKVCGQTYDIIQRNVFFSLHRDSFKFHQRLNKFDRSESPSIQHALDQKQLSSSFEELQIRNKNYFKIKGAIKRQLSDKKDQIISAITPNYLNECSWCEQIIDHDGPKAHIILMNCGHIIHQDCLSLPFCQRCSQKLEKQIESVIATNELKSNKTILQEEEIIRRDTKETNQVVKQRREFEQELELSQDDLKLYQEQKILRNLEMFDQAVDLQNKQQDSVLRIK